MKIIKTNFYIALFTIVLLSQLYVSSFKINIFLQIGVLALYFFFEKAVVSISFIRQILPLFYIFMLGFVGTLIQKYALFNIIKDIFHIVKPILGVMIGYFLFKKIDNFKLFIQIIVLCGFVSAIIHFIILLSVGDLFSGSINSIREFGRDNFLELFSIFFLGYYKKFEKAPLFRRKLNHWILFTILLISNILYFSRTMIVVSVILFLSVYGYTVITRKSLKIIVAIIFSILVFYGYLFSVRIDRSNPGLESFLYKIKMAPAEVFVTKIDRDNHEDLWDHWRGYEAKRAFQLMLDNPSSFVVGTGYGSLVNLKFFAPLSDDPKEKGMKYISELHNGYVYVFYKLGFVGLFIYLLLLLKWYKQVYKDKNFMTIYIGAIGLVYLFTTLAISGLYNGRDVIIFILGALLFFEQKKKTTLTIESV